ncbi:MAG: hypothetical protein EAZ09_22060 [Oscillatoriales cyanobacterium]|nr:MAG: hypothetical protein EAZ18_18925 [Oscillatoriales cyanobacterium]TAH16334.1 MAG: hypothetical protein EAZ09_22060 [Oscillatoriales cyanobacterium]
MEINRWLKKTDKNSRKDVVGNRSQAYNNDTAYNLTFDSLTGFPIESGFFSARKPEHVSLDWLLDGGNKQNGGSPSPTSTTSFAANFPQPAVNSLSSIGLSMLGNLRSMMTNVNPGFELNQSLPPNLPKPEELQVFPHSSDIDAFTRHASRRRSFGTRLWWPGR